MTGPLSRPLQRGREIRCRHFQHGILNNHICETVAYKDLGDRGGASTSDYAELELFVDQSMTLTSLHCRIAIHQGTLYLLVEHLATFVQVLATCLWPRWAKLLAMLLPGCGPNTAGRRVSRFSNGHKRSQEFSRRRRFQRFHLCQTADGSRDDTTLSRNSEYVLL